MADCFFHDELEITQEGGRIIASYHKGAIVCESNNKFWRSSYRLGYLGGTDVYPILASHYNWPILWDTPFTIWCKKSGYKIVRKTAAMQAGIDQEPIIRSQAADIIAHHFGEKVQVFESPYDYRSREAICLGGRIDGLAQNQYGKVFGIEIKTTSKMWKVIPAQYMAQIQHYMDVTALDAFYLITKCKDKISCDLIKWDKEHSDDRKFILKDFWSWHVSKQLPPIPMGIAHIEGPYLDLLKHKAREMYDAIT